MAASASDGSDAISSEAARPNMLCIRNSYCMDVVSAKDAPSFWRCHCCCCYLRVGIKYGQGPTHVIGQARDFVSPDFIVAEGMVGK